MKHHTRNLELNASVESLERSDLIEFSVASSEPFFRANEDNPNDGYYEVLVIGEENIDFSRMVDGKCPFLFEHDTEKQLGVVEKSYLSDGKLKILVRFSENDFPQTVLKDILSGIRRNVSVGYIVMETKVQQNRGDFPTVYITKWQPYECSSCTVPADHTVGYQRNLTNDSNQGITLNMDDKDKLQEQDSEQLDTEKQLDEVQNNATSTQADTSQNQPQTETPKPEDKELDPADEAEDILAAGELAGEEELARTCIQEKRSLKEFKQLVKQKRNLKEKNSMETPKKYSITKAIRSIWKGTKDAEYEMNISHNAQRTLNAEDDHDLFVPIGQFRALSSRSQFRWCSYQYHLLTNRVCSNTQT